MENLKLTIRHSEMGDYEKMLAIYARAREFMAATGNPKQWNTTWPPAEVIKADIEDGKNSFVAIDEDGDIVATFFFMMENDPTYDYIEDGAWKSSDPYGVVHRIAVSGKVKGAGAYCINWAYDRCREAGRNLRIDTHGDNKIMQKLVTCLGFEYCGIIYVREDPDPRYAYEKVRKESTLHCMLDEALAEVKKGNTKSAAESFASLEKQFGIKAE